MKIGIFDSGLGGLNIARSIHQLIPEYDSIYLGDTMHVPYGNRSSEMIYKLTERAVTKLFAEDCKLIIIACNTASAKALRKLQQEYLPKYYPDRRILGVIVPTLETAISLKVKKIGLIATSYIVDTAVYTEELNKLDNDIEILPVATPLLVPLIENDGHKWVKEILSDYLKNIQDKNIDSIILGCTHYGILKEVTQEILGDTIQVISQDEFIPIKLKQYLNNHNEIEAELNKDNKYQFLVTDLTSNYQDKASAIYGRKIELVKTNI